MEASLFGATLSIVPDVSCAAKVLSPAKRLRSYVVETPSGVIRRSRRHLTKSEVVKTATEARVNKTCASERDRHESWRRTAVEAMTSATKDRRLIEPIGQPWHVFACVLCVQRRSPLQPNP